MAKNQARFSDAETTTFHLTDCHGARNIISSNERDVDIEVGDDGLPTADLPGMTLCSDCRATLSDRTEWSERQGV